MPTLPARPNPILSRQPKPAKTDKHTGALDFRFELREQHQAAVADFLMQVATREGRYQPAKAKKTPGQRRF